jgi:hypothetical protein
MSVCGERMSEQVSDVLLQKAHAEYAHVPRMTDKQTTLHAHLRSIRTALVAMAVSILATGLIIADEDGLGFPLFIITLLVCGYAFVPTLLSRLRGQ